MSYYGTDPFEVDRLRQENRYMHEQVRTLSATLNDRHTAQWIILKGRERSIRPAHKTAASRLLVTDELIQDAAFDVAAYSVRECMAKIEALPDKGAPLDRIWRFMVERDYIA